MKSYTRKINRFDEYTESWFTDEITEYPFVESLCQKIANILPKKVVYYCYVRFLAFATTHGEGSNCLQKPHNIHRNRLKTLAFYY